MNSNSLVKKQKTKKKQQKNPKKNKMKIEF